MSAKPAFAFFLKKIEDSEEAEGLNMKPDRKSVLRILDKLAVDGKLFIHTVTLANKEVSD